MILGNLFQGIDADSAQRLSEFGTLQEFEEDFILVKAGQELPSNLYIVQENSHVEIHKVDSNGNLLKVANLDMGDACGEVAFVERGPRLASIRVLAKSKLFVIPYEALDKWFKEDVNRKALFFENLSRILIHRFINY